MDFTENGFLAVTVIIGGIICIALSNILNCAERQSAKNRKVLKQKWPSNDSLQYQYFPSSEATTLSRRHKGLNLNWTNSDQRKNTSGIEKVNYTGIVDNSQKRTELSPTFISCAADISVNNDSLEEQTAVAQVGSTSTQMTNTFTSMQSCGNLSRNLNLNHMISKSDSISEMAAGDEELPNRLKSNTDDKSILPEEKSWISGHYDPHCDDGSLQILAKHKNCDKKVAKKEMIEEYKLLESVAAMIRKYEEQSHVESEQNTHNF